VQNLQFNSNKPLIYLFIAVLPVLSACSGEYKAKEQLNENNFSTLQEVKQPNILFAISDDQSYPHASAYGYKAINTPAFDRIAREGVLFNNAFSASPGCSPSRAALLTGLNCWQLEQAGTHASSFPTEYVVYPDILEEAGYFAGYTQKGWGPGNWEVSGRSRNPAGNLFNSHKLSPAHRGISHNNYAANFDDFLKNRPEGKPFLFWYGASEPHRVFEKGSGLKAGKKLEDVTVPSFLPDTEEVRSDILDYALEIEWFDQHLGKMIALLEEAGELDNTIIVVTSDNGMSFPRAKANLYEYGFHVPLAIRWGDKVKGGRVVDDIVNLIDLAPTYLQAAGIEDSDGINRKYPMEGRSLMNILLSDKEGLVDSTRKATYAARERHSSSRWDNLTYPQRSLRTHKYL
jgi:N-sulfoglucosamine sulfohydrolase